ncbi:MAG: aminopeptidase P family protein [Deltaproteobacteria bacterium]|nr:aminopeptidase P family protein [Deltaproteobacteria bacterium]
MPGLGPNEEQAEALIAERLNRLRMRLAEEGCPNALITGSENRRYFSGFKAGDPMLTESSGALLITPDKQYLLTDSRYTLAAGKEAPLFEVLETQRGLAETLAGKELFKGGLWFEAPYLTMEVFGQIKYRLKNTVFKNLPFSLNRFREVKTPGEVALIQKALFIAEAAVDALRNSLEPGWTEEQAAILLERVFREKGASGPAFETIVASGPQAALPHAEPGPRIISEGELVVVDCGSKLEGYASDITRTLAVGQVLPWQKEIYRIVRAAQLKALACLSAGKTGAQVDKAARDHIAENGYGRFFGHSLGHGVGLAVHEGPSLSPANLEPLAAGAVVTVEPGIYLPGRGGVRLEQMALVTEDGCRVLNADDNFYDF